MENLKISTAQFENKSGDKSYNLDVIDELTRKAASDGADVISFHECSITGYSFARKLSKEEMLKLSEPIPSGPSTKRLIKMASTYKIAIMAGLFEKDEHGDIYKAYICVTEDGVIGKYRKLHPFINPHIKPGNEYCVFKLKGWNCGILICYDNNIIENVRATRLLGADVLFMPHVTMCTPSTRPGAGFVDPKLWENKEKDPTSLHLEFDGMKGRSWLMKWLPSRAFDNGMYVVFSNPIGMDDDQLKNGCSMIIDPFGDILTECRTFEDEIATALLSPEKLVSSGGFRYIQARKPSMYRKILSEDHTPKQIVSWMDYNKKN